MQSEKSQSKYSKSLLTTLNSFANSFHSQKSKKDDFNKEIDEHICELATLLNTISQQNIILSNLISNEQFREFLDSVSSWLSKNYNSPKLINILDIFSYIFHLYNHPSEISKKDIISLIQCDTLSQINEKKNELSKEETLSPDSILTNSFLMVIYFLLVTISNKPELIIKSPNFLKTVITISSQIVEIDNVALFFKKKRLISTVNTIVKELRKSNDQNGKNSLIEISKLAMCLYSKIGLKRPIYRDYMFKKAIPDKMCDIYLQYYKTDVELIKTFALYTVFTSRTSDHKTFFWTKGVTNTFVDLLSSSKDEYILEPVALSVYELTKNSEEIQEDLKEQNYLELAKKLVVNYSKNNNIIFYTVSTLRRIKDDEFYNKMSLELLYTFFALFDYYYLTVKKEIEGMKEQGKELSTLSSETQFIVLKEIVAILGNIVKEEVHTQPIIEKNMHIILIDLKLTFIIFPKLIKNTIGALINLTNNPEIRNSLCKVAAFVQSIYLVFKQYQDNPYIIDYELRLVLNLLKNEIAVNIFLSGDMFFYTLLFIKDFKENEIIVLNSLKIIRCLIVKVKGLEEFKEKLVEFYQAIFDFDIDHDEIKAFYYFIGDMNAFLDSDNENYISINVLVEIINLLAYIANQNETFKGIIGKNDRLIKNLHKLITSNSTNENSNKNISSAIAQLPIEELNIIK